VDVKYFLLVLGVFLANFHAKGFGSALCSTPSNDPSIVYLSWMHDPCHTMTVQWHTSKNERTSKISYQKSGESKDYFKMSQSVLLSGTQTVVNTVELTGLKPDTEYFFKIEGQETCYKFRTMPERLTREVKFVVGGDVFYFFDRMKRLDQDIVKKDPDFIVVGGDIAYAYGRARLFRSQGWEMNRWRGFLREWKEQMIGADGRLIPMVVVIGNHDVKNGEKDPAKRALIFYELFAMPEKNTSYRMLDFGTYLSLFLLDTGHSHPILGKQTSWLEEALAKGNQNKMAAYHVAAYPSVYPFNGRGPLRIRQAWVPLFEQYGVNTAFEHHNHAYKRTFPIKGNQVDPNGVVYLGDGVWGVNPRKVHQKAWYLEKAEPINSYWLVTLNAKQNQFQSFDVEGNLVEEFKQNLKSLDTN
jgi:hypothetical protein